MFCCDFTKRKGEEPQNDSGLVTFSKDKRAGEPFFSMLAGCGLKKSVQFRNAAIKGGAVVLTGKRSYFKHKRFFYAEGPFSIAWSVGAGFPED